MPLAEKGQRERLKNGGNTGLRVMSYSDNLIWTFVSIGVSPWHSGRPKASEEPMCFRINAEILCLPADATRSSSRDFGWRCECLAKPKVARADKGSFDSG